MVRTVKTVEPALLIRAYQTVTDNRDSGNDHADFIFR